MRIIILLMFICSNTSAQVLEGANAYQNTFASFERPCTGKMSNGHFYFAGFINHYDTASVITNIECFRLDMNTGEVIYKTLPSLSSQSVLWVWAMDSLGHVWASLSSSVRRLYEFNFKDSIWYRDHGGLPDETGARGNELAYSFGMGTDGNLHIGTSSWRPMILYFDRKRDTLISYGSADPKQDYVLSISGDKDYIYEQVGQKSKNYLICTNKTTGEHTKIDSIATNSRFNIRARNDGFVYYSNAVGNYRLNGPERTKVTSFGGTKYIEYYEMGDVGQPRLTASYFDPTKNELSYSISNGISGKVTINAENILAKIGFLWTSNADSNIIIYQGEYYGSVYEYDRAGKKATVTGKGIGNIYSVAQIDDSTFALGCYPSGLLLEFNINQPWTVGVYDAQTNTVSGISPTSNPRFLCNMITKGGFNHVYGLVYDSVYDVLIGSGNIDRVADGVGICAYFRKTGEVTGYDYNKIPANCNYRDLKLWGNKALLSIYGASGRVYVYDYLKNFMADSIVDKRFTNFGKLYPVGDLLLCIANNRYVKINMAKQKTVIYDSTTTAQNYFHTMLPDGRIAVNGWFAPPKDFWPFKWLGNKPDQSSYSGFIGSYFSAVGKTIVQTPNVTNKQFDLKKAYGIEQFINNKLTNNE